MNKKVKLKTITPDIERTVVEIARVSSKAKDKKAKPEKLINYLIRNSHWSPFEHGSITMEINTSRDIGTQLIRHRSFTFQEFSQRYQDVNLLADDEENPSMFDYVELRKQCENNRQSSTEVYDPIIDLYGEDELASEAIKDLFQHIALLYDRLLAKGVARETARRILPMATKTRIYMTGSIRSWIHFLNLRLDSHAQKEIRIIAQEIEGILREELPIIFKALDK